jgi:hypothetical protein
MAGFFTLLTALLHGPAAGPLLHLGISVIQLAAALLKATSGAFAVLAAALTLAGACVARRQNTRSPRREKRPGLPQRRPRGAARAPRTAGVPDPAPADGGQARQSRPKPQPLEYGAGHPEGEV